MKLKKRNRKRKGERVLELIGEVPHVGIGPGESRESKGSDPYVLERLRTRMRYTGVSSVCFSKVFLHFSLSVCCFFSVLCSVFYFILFFHPRFSFLFFSDFLSLWFIERVHSHFGSGPRTVRRPDPVLGLIDPILNFKALSKFKRVKSWVRAQEITSDYI